MKDPSENKQLYGKRKILEKEIRRLSNQLEKCEKEIEDLENKIAVLDASLSDPSKMNVDTADHKFYDNYAGFKKMLTAKMNEWEQISNSLEELQKERSNYY